MSIAASPEPPEEAPFAVSAEQGLAFAFEAAEQQQYDLNRRAAARAAAIADALEYARSRPWIYALPGDPDDVKTAERCAVMEASCRLQLSETAVRTLAFTAETARAQLPLLWAQVREGFAPLAHAEAAVALVPALATDAASLRIFDETLADLALRATVGQFRAAARRLANRLGARSPEERHADAFAERRVVMEPVDDGMAWVQLFTTKSDALAIMRRVTSTAKHISRDPHDGRSRDQIRADLLTAWLRGVGTPTAVKTKVFVTVPITLLGKKARSSVRPGLQGGRVDLNDGAQLVGDDDLDEATAIRMLLEAGSFTRVITDPVTGVILDMDRRARKVTRAQREWLILTHGTCTRDGCSRHAADADIDHWIAFHGPGGGAGGPTNLGNLHPFCTPDHKTRHASRVRYRRRPDHSVQAIFPTGHRTGFSGFTILKPPPDHEHPPF